MLEPDWGGFSFGVGVEGPAAVLPASGRDGSWCWRVTLPCAGGPAQGGGDVCVCVNSLQGDIFPASVFFVVQFTETRENLKSSIFA